MLTWISRPFIFLCHDTSLKDLQSGISTDIKFSTRVLSTFSTVNLVAREISFSITLTFKAVLLNLCHCTLVCTVVKHWYRGLYLMRIFENQPTLARITGGSSFFKTLAASSNSGFSFLQCPHLQRKCIVFTNGISEKQDAFAHFPSTTTSIWYSKHASMNFQAYSYASTVCTSMLIMITLLKEKMGLFL